MDKEPIWVDMTPEKAEELRQALDKMQNDPDYWKKTRQELESKQVNCLPVNTDMPGYTQLTYRDMRIIQIVMNLLRQHRITSATTNVNVFEEVKKQLAKDQRQFAARKFGK